MTNEQIAASRDYNLMVLWTLRRQNGVTPAQMAEEHEEWLKLVVDTPNIQNPY